MKTTTRASLTSIGFAALLAGCVVAPPSAPMPVAVQASYAPVAYTPMPNDVYISTVVERDVVFVGGSTYIWVVGTDGVRRRQLYAYGDHRQEIFHRREELHRVMMAHGGHLPDHPPPFGHEHPNGPMPVAQGPAPGRPGPMPNPAVAQNRPGAPMPPPNGAGPGAPNPGAQGHPGGPAPVAHGPVPGKPVPRHKDEKKT